MKQLKPLSHSQLSTEELQFFALQAMGLIQPLSGSSEFLARQHTHLENATDSVEQLTGLSRRSELSPLVAGADDKQDALMIAIRETAQAKVAARIISEAAADAGEKVLQTIEGFGKKLIYGSYEEQSVAIPSFIAKMSTPEMSDTVEKAGVKKFLEVLSPVHEEFQELFKEKLNMPDLPKTTLAEEKRKIRYRLGGLLAYIELQIADSVELYVKLKEPMNALITEVMARKRARDTRAENSAS